MTCIFYCLAVTSPLGVNTVYKVEEMEPLTEHSPNEGALTPQKKDRDAAAHSPNGGAEDLTQVKKARDTAAHSPNGGAEDLTQVKKTGGTSAHSPNGGREAEETGKEAKAEAPVKKERGQKRKPIDCDVCLAESNTKKRKRERPNYFRL